MKISPGTRIGAFDVVEMLGAGGMGEVYRARDTRLGRDVAIKVLPEEFSADASRARRFEQEARAASALNHPNIVSIYDIGVAESSRFIAMELIEGRTLRELLESGAVPIRKAIAIATQIANGLAAAHERSIVHRDLKPENIIVSKDGVAKILDFGLARIDSASDELNTVRRSEQTKPGTVMGTCGYMSPEQASGLQADFRSDQFSFGAILYEMLTGRRAFTRETAAQTLASIIEDEPPAIDARVPAPLRWIVERCLAKEPNERFASTRDLAHDLTMVGRHLTEIGSGADLTVTPAPRRRNRMFIETAVAVVLLAIGAAAVMLYERTRTAAPVYASIEAPRDSVLGEDDQWVSLPTRTPMVFTVDGRALIIEAAINGKPQLYMRPLDSAEAKAIPGTEDARVPFVSPDGKWIGFFQNQEIKKLPMEGGIPIKICALEGTLGPTGVSWSAGNEILFGDPSEGRIMRVSADGGTPVPVTDPPPRERLHVNPFFLPDGKRFLFADVSVDDASDTRLMVQSLDGGAPRLLITNATDGRLLPNGRLLFMRLGTLMAAQFDAARGMIKGGEAPAMTGIMQSALRARANANNTGAGMYAVSTRGALAAIRGPLASAGDNTLLWISLDGKISPAEEAAGAPSGARLYARISPDQTRAAMTVIESTRRQLWIVDWKRQTWTACHDCGAAICKVWSPDGQRLLTSAPGPLELHTLDGSSPPVEILREANRGLCPAAWLSDGRIVYVSAGDSGSEIKLLEPGAKSGRVIVPLGLGTEPAVSPDARWLTYESQVSNEPSNIIVQPFPGPGPRLQVSAGEAYNPSWSADGKTVYYLTRKLRADGRFEGTVHAVDVVAGNRIAPGVPRDLFHVPGSQQMYPVHGYDISTKPARFLMFDAGDASAKRESVTRMDLVLNWTSTLAQR